MLLSKLNDSNFITSIMKPNHNAEQNFAVRQDSHLKGVEIQIFLYSMNKNVIKVSRP